MEKETQFKINSIAELERAYNYFQYEWYPDYSLKGEKKEFIENENLRYITKTIGGYIFIDSKRVRFKQVPTPFFVIGSPTWSSELEEKPNKYAVSIRGIELDVYDILQAHNVRNPALQHLIKKCLHGGMRGHKSREQDLKDIIASAKRAYEIEFKND